MSGSVAHSSEVQKNNARCPCCACKGLTKHPYSIEEAQVASALLSLPFEYPQANRNNQQLPQKHPLLQIVLDYYYENSWLTMCHIAGVLNVILDSNNDANSNGTTAKVPRVVRESQHGPLVQYGVLDVTLPTYYKKVPLINSSVQFTVDDIKKLHHAVQETQAGQQRSDEIISFCGHFKVSVRSDRVGAVKIERKTCLRHTDHVQELWCDPELLAALLQSKKRCVIS